MTTVIQVVQHLRPGGIETQALELMRFGNSGDKQWIISLEGRHAHALERWPRLRAVSDRLIFLDKKPGLQPTLCWRLARLLRQLEADIVHSHHVGPLLYSGVAARLAGNIRLVHTEHDAWHFQQPRRGRLLAGLLQLLRPQLAADARAVAAPLSQLCPGLPVAVIPNGIDTRYFVPGDAALARAQLGLPPTVPLIGCSGRLEEVKGQCLLIEALARLPAAIHLALAGSGSSEARLRHQAANLGLVERVHFLGCLDDMPRFYQALDLFCLPSLNEGCPLSSLEAQACNVPTLVTDVGGSAETLCLYSGVLCRAGSATALANALQRMLDGPGAIAPCHFVRRLGDIRTTARAYAKLRNPEACYE